MNKVTVALVSMMIYATSVQARCIKSDGLKCTKYGGAYDAVQISGYRLTVKAKPTRSGGISYSWMFFTPGAIRFQFQSELTGVIDGRPQNSPHFKIIGLIDF